MSIFNTIRGWFSAGTTTDAENNPMSVGGIDPDNKVQHIKLDANHHQKVAADALPLPSGASTSSLQTTGNNSLSSIDGKTPALVTGRIPVDGSGVTQPVSAASLPLPSGAATDAKQDTGNSSLSSIDGKTPTLVTGRVPVDPSGVTSPISVASLPLPSGASTSALQNTGNSSLTSIDGKLPAQIDNKIPVAATVDGSVSDIGIMVEERTSWVPDPKNYTAGTRSVLNKDISGALETRGLILTDETSFRTDFAHQIPSNLTGTVSFTNNNTTVTGSGTAFLSELDLEHYIKYTSHGREIYARISNIVSDTELELESPYSGATISGVGIKSKWIPYTVGGGTISVASSKVELSVGTANLDEAAIDRIGDYPPYSVGFSCYLSQRIANQIFYLGLIQYTGVYEGTIEAQAVVFFNGTDNTKVGLRTCWSSSDIQETVFTLPSGLTTASSIEYNLDILSHKVSLSVNGTRLGEHRLHIPGPYTDMGLHACIENTGVAASGTTAYIDTLYLTNYDQIQISSHPTFVIGGADVNGDAQKVRVDSNGRLITTSPASQGVTNSLNYENTAGAAALVGAMWRRVITYTVPTGYTFNLIQFQSSCGSLAGSSRCVKIINFGSFNTSTNVFTDADSYPTSQFASKLVGLVTTVMSATATTLTATYVNQDGVAGRTATATITSAAVVDSQFVFTLQAGDFGVKDVTAVTDSAAPTGVVNLIGVDELSYHRHTTADLIFESIAGGNAVVIPSGVGGVIGLEFTSTGTASTSRLLKALFTLYPTST